MASSATFSASCICIYPHKSLRLKCGHVPEVLIHQLQELEPLELLPPLARLHSLQGEVWVQDEEQCFIGKQIPGR